MKIIAFLFMFALLGGIAFAQCGCASAKPVDVGSSIGAEDKGPKNPTAIAAQNKTKDKNQTMEQALNQTGNMTMNQTQEMEQTGKPEKEKKGKGISEQVHQIIAAKKNGTIDVPQGFLVRIIAKNHSLSIENATEMLNESLIAKVKVNGKNKTLKIEPDTDTVNITDENVTVETNETIEIVNDTLSVAGKKVLIMPASVPGKIKTKTIKSAVLHIVNGDPEYMVNATKKAKIFGLFDADMDVEIDLDAVNGKIKNEKRPWWSFLASVEDDEE
jgi:hypothetical protein